MPQTQAKRKPHRTRWMSNQARVAAHWSRILVKEILVLSLLLLVQTGVLLAAGALVLPV